MKKKIQFLAVACFFLASMIGTAAHSQNVQDFGDYAVHFNALNTSFLPPAVAKNYGIKRSESRGMLNVTVLQKVLGMVGKPVRADITASATNLTGQHKALSLREVHEGNAIYYIGEFAVSNEETLDFALEVKPEGSDNSLEVNFRQQFYTK